MKKKFNILDWFIICIVIFLIVFGVCRLFLFGKSSVTNNAKNGAEILTENVTADVTFKVKGIKEVAADKLTKDAECFDNTGKSIGKILTIKKENYKEYNLNLNNEYVQSVYDDRFDVVFTMSFTGNKTVSGFETEGSAVLGVGTVRYITCNGITYEATAIDVSVK